MDKLEDFPPISRHVRYALVRNSIVQNGEYQKKLNEIGRDHRRKAGEILHGRSQAVRDHVINSFQAAQRQTTNRRVPSRWSISRDREIMTKINELSGRYLLGPIESLPQNFHHSDFPSPRIYNNSAITALLSKQQQTSKVTDFKRTPERKHARLLRSFSSTHVPTPQMYRGSTQQQTLKRWSSVTSEQLHNRQKVSLHPREPITRPRTLSAGNLAIRRRSCEFSLSSKSLLQLQQVQQRSRLSKDLSKNESINPDFIEVKSLTARTLDADKKLSEIPTKIDKKVEKFCNRLTSASLQSNQPPDKKERISETAEDQPKETKKFEVDFQSDEGSSDEKTPTLKSNLTKNKKNFRKRSVRWSDSVKSDE